MSPVGHRPPRHPANAIRGVPIDSGRGGEGKGGMQINGGGKHHALTKFYLDKSVDTEAPP